MNLTIFTLLLAFCLLFTVFSDTDLLCMNNNQNARFNRGDTTVICVHFIPNNDRSKAMRLAFQVVVDKYTAVQARGAYNSFRNYNALSSLSLIVQADSNSTTSSNVTYMRKSTDLTSSDIVIPIFSIVVNIDNGKVADVSWDNGCWDCTSMCYLDKINVNTTQSICRINPCNTTQNGSTTACDPKIYVSWIGTDSNGNHMNSAGLRISRFRQYSIGEMYSSALNTYDSVLQSAKDSFNQNIENNLNTLFGNSGTTLQTISFVSKPFDNTVISYKYTLAGGNKNPGFSWTAIQSAQSYAFVMNHTNSSGSFTDFLVKNIPSGATQMTDGDLAGGSAVINDHGVFGYSGPELNNKNETNTYKCYFYGLSVASINATTVKDFYVAIETYKVALGSFSGTYLNTTTTLLAF